MQRVRPSAAMAAIYQAMSIGIVGNKLVDFIKENLTILPSRGKGGRNKGSKKYNSQSGFMRFKNAKHTAEIQRHMRQFHKGMIPPTAIWNQTV